MSLCFAFLLLFPIILTTPYYSYHANETRVSSPDAAPRHSAQRVGVSSPSLSRARRRRSRHTESSQPRFASELMNVRSRPTLDSYRINFDFRSFCPHFPFGLFYPGRHVPVPYLPVATSSRSLPRLFKWASTLEICFLTSMPRRLRDL